jgi:hypothetical protein
MLKELEERDERAVDVVTGSQSLLCARDERETWLVVVKGVDVSTV